MAKERPEEIIDRIKTEVSEKFLAENPVKKFPEDFLSVKAKKELAERIYYPPLPFRRGMKMTGRDHRIRREKIDLRAAMKAYAFVEEFEAKSPAKYVEIGLPGGKLKLNIGSKFEICFAKSGTVLLGFGTLERAKYILYSREHMLRSKKPTLPKQLQRPGAATQSVKDILPDIRQYVYKVPKSEIVVKRAVQKYEKYAGEMREKLIKAYVEKGAERTVAESLVMMVFEEIGLGNLTGK